MVADASIYGLLKPVAPPPDPMEQYGKIMSLQNMMGAQELQGMQVGKLRRGIAEEDALNAALVKNPNITIKELMQFGAPGRAAGTTLRQGEQAQVAIDKTKLDINIAKIGAMARVYGIVAAGGGSDQSIADAEAEATSIVGPDVAKAVTKQLLALPQEQRMPTIIGKAVQDPIGRLALESLGLLPEKASPIGAGGLRTRSGELIPPMARPAAPPQQSPLARLIAERDALPPGDPRIVTYDDAITKQSKNAPPNPAVQIFQSPISGEDDKGNKVFVQPSGREGVAPRILPGVRPVTPRTNPIAEAVADTIRGARNGQPAATTTATTRPAVPKGIPSGSVQIGQTPEGKLVWKDPTGKNWVE